MLAVSADSQGDTLEHQRDWAAQTAREKGWHVERFVGEGRDGVGSGKDGPRPIVQRMLADLRALPAASRPSWLLVTRADRFGRGEDIIENQLVLRDLSRLGVRVWARLGGEKKADTIMEQLANALEAAMAAQENVVRRDKTLEKHRQRRNAGLPVGYKRPYGLKMGPGGIDVAIEDEANVVRRIFALRVDGHGYASICRQIAPAAPPRQLRTGQLVELRWTERRIRATLLNRAYIGPVIDEVTFHRAQAVAARVGRAWPSRRHPWPLSGSLRCYCGHLTHGRWSSRDNARRYYVCQSRWNHDGKLRFIRAERIEGHFIALLDELVRDPDRIAVYRDVATNAPASGLLERALDAVRNEVTAANEQRARVWSLHAAGHVRDEDIQERLDQIRTRIDDANARAGELEAQLAMAAAATRRTSDTAELVRKARELYESATDDERRALTRTVALDLGGLCAEPDGMLSVRTPAVSGKLERRQSM